MTPIIEEEEEDKKPHNPFKSFLDEKVEINVTGKDQFDEFVKQEEKPKVENGQVEEVKEESPVKFPDIQPAARLSYSPDETANNTKKESR